MGGRGSGSGKYPDAKVSPSGILPKRIKASSLQDAVDRFNTANAAKQGIGYKVMKVSLFGAKTEVAKTLDGKPVPKSIEPRIITSLSDNHDGTFGFYNY